MENKNLPQKGVINVFTYPAHEMAFVYVEDHLVMLGNYGDFYPLCHGITSVKGVEISQNWSSYKSLSQELSQRFNLPIKMRQLTSPEYQTLMK